MVPAHNSLQGEISGLASFISIRQFIASPVIVGVTHIIHHDNVLLDIREILDFLVISFPLTLSIALLYVMILKGKFNMFTLVFTVAGAALLSNLLHWILTEIPVVDLNKIYNDSIAYDQNTGGNSSALRWVGNMFRLYWKIFGPVLFIQSCCIGIYAGYKYLKLEEKKLAKKAGSSAGEALKKSG